MKPTPPPVFDMNKALAAGGSTLLAGAVTKILVRIINVKWPGFLDSDTTDSIGVIVVALLSLIATYYMPSRNLE